MVKSYGKTTWTDKTGKENSRFGPLYLHFQISCLENYDSDIFYRFDYSRISADSKCVSQLEDSEIQFLLNKGVKLAGFSK